MDETPALWVSLAPSQFDHPVLDGASHVWVLNAGGPLLVHGPEIRAFLRDLRDAEDCGNVDMLVFNEARGEQGSVICLDTRHALHSQTVEGTCVGVRLLGGSDLRAYPSGSLHRSDHDVVVLSGTAPHWVPLVPPARKGTVLTWTGLS